MSFIDIAKKIFYGIWIAAVIFFLFLFLFNRTTYLNPEYLSDLIHQYENYVWAIYIGISFIRGFFLIPSTPFVLLGIVLFPGQPIEVLTASMAGVCFSATLLYFFSDSIGFSDYLEKNYPEKAHWMKEKLGGKYQFPFIYGWSIFPPVPTDLICYITGILKVRYWVMILGVFMGELTLNVIYVFMGQKVIELLY